MAWLRLFRIALAPSIVWDVSAGAILAYYSVTEAGSQPFPWAPWALTVACVLLIFHAGMALNDWADRAEDSRVGRKRPLVTGEISPTAALTVATLMFATALGIASYAITDGATVAAVLVLCVILYDLARGEIRTGLGPMLLSLCRGASLTLGMLTVIPLDGVFEQAQTLWAVVAYMIYVLFLGRLASNEEAGGPGKRMVVFAAGSALAPLFLMNHAQPQWLAPIAWTAFAVWLLLPAIRDAQQFEWPPQRVQLAVRRALVGLPCVTAIAVLASSAPVYWALGGIAALGSVRLMVRAFPPE